MPAAGGVGIRRGDQNGGRIAREIQQDLLERRDRCRPMPPAVAAYSVSGRHCSTAARLNASIADSQTVTRAGDRATWQAEQCLGAARRKVAVIRAAHLNAGQKSPAVPVREPGAAARTFRTASVLRAAMRIPSGSPRCPMR